MADETFSETSLTEKLVKLNSSQQSIESLSKWCISNRKKAKQVVETWEKYFKSAKHEQRIAMLYLANDTLQNSRRKGSEFVNEFWKVLPGALKVVYDSGNENCKKVSRLVEIWEERKVFGSRGQSLKNEMASKNPSPVNSVKISNPIKVMKRDATSLRIKLAVGGLPEKILTGLQFVHDDDLNEVGLDKFHTAVSCVREIEKNVLYASSQGNFPGSDVVDSVLKHEIEIKECISEFEKSEAVRVDLISQLREALQVQETKLEQIRSEILVGQSQIDQAASIKLQLMSNSTPTPLRNHPKVEAAYPPGMTAPNLPVPPPSNPQTSFLNTEEENTKAKAAAVAARLAASTSSAQMLTSIFSSLLAEEAASMSSGIKRPRLEQPMTLSDGKNPEGPNSAYFPTSQQLMTSMPPIQSTTQSMNQLQPPFLPPPLLATPGNNNMTGIPYAYGANHLLPPTGFARGPPPQQTQTQQQQPPVNGGYFRPIGIGFYGQTAQPPTPLIHRQ